MPCCGNISEINRIGAEELSVEWIIKKFLSLPGGSYNFYDSPRFKFCDARWRLRLYPNVSHEGQNRASVTLDLIKVTEGPPKTFKISVGIRGSSGMEMQREAEKEFTNANWYCEWEEFCWRSELKEHKARLMPDNILAVTCSIKTSDAVRAAFEEDGNEDKNLRNVEQPSQVKKTKKISFPVRHGGVIHSLKSILAEGRRADFILKLGGREWPVHRAILEGRSRHFETEWAKFQGFQGEWANTDEVLFSYITESSLEGVLNFMYAGEVGDMSVENVCGIYAAAHEFLLEDLKSLCVEYMKEKMCPEMVCGALVIAEACGDGDLKESALEFFFQESNRIVVTEGWKYLKKNHPAIIGELFEEFIKRERKNRKKEQD